MSDPPEGLAYFTSGAGPKIPVHFNPNSLRVSLTNQFGEDPPSQHAKATTAKLDVELMFDTTESGADVRAATEALRGLAVATGTAPKAGAKPPAKGGAGQKDEANYSLPQIVFHWGTTSFEGVIESLTETLDYWSSDGIPLRAAITLSMKGSALKTEGSKQAAAYSDNPLPDFDDVIPIETPPGATGATFVGAWAGDPGAGRMLAALNGMENMRAPMGAAMGASASVNLSAAAGFKMSGGISAGASAGFGAGFGAGASIGFGVGASAGASAAAGLSASVGVGMAAGAGFGASAGAGFGASAGASFGASAGALFGASAGASFGASAGASFGASAGASFGASAGAGIGSSGFATSSATKVTGFDGVTRTQTSSSLTGFDGTTTSSRSVSVSAGAASAGVAAADGAFIGLGTSRTTLPSARFDPALLLPPPGPAVGAWSRFDSTGKVIGGGGGQVAAGYSASAGVTFF